MSDPRSRNPYPRRGKTPVPSEAEHTDELNHVWTATYSPVGQVATLTNPLNKTWTYTWTPVGDPNDTNFYRLTKVTDPLGDWVRYKYADPQDPNDPPDPTLVTEIIEMSATGEPNDPNGVTHLEYYVDDPNEPRTSSHGQLKHVIDANGVVTFFWYDDYGYSSTLYEGWIDSLVLNGGAGYPVFFSATNDAVGRTTVATSDFGESQVVFDVADCARSGACCHTGPHDPHRSWVACAYPDPNDPNDPNFPLPGQDLPDRLGSNLPTVLIPCQVQCLNGADYDATGRPLWIERCIPNFTESAGLEGFEAERRHTITYDPFRRPEQVQVKSYPENSSTASVTRTAEVLEYDEEGRPLSMLDPSGRQLDITYDDRGDVDTVYSGGIWTEYDFDDAQRLTDVEFYNGARTHYNYDAANRVSGITHYDDTDAVLASVGYAYLDDDTLDAREEYDAALDSLGEVDFGYDHRKRLTHEQRAQDDQTVYDITYTYDQLGNRQTRYDAVSGLYTEYDYDVDVAPGDLDFPTRHNRLLRYRVYAGQEGPLLRTVTYTYLRNGNASNITVKDEYFEGGGGFPASPGDPNDYDWHYDLALHYYTNGQLWRAGWSRWKCDEAGEPIGGTYEKFGMREFRYDDARARYLSADFPVVLEPDDENPQPATLPYAGTDYLGVMPAGDAEIDYDAQSQTWSVEDTTLYLAGIAGQQDAATEEVEYFHSDLLGSTSLVTDDEGEPVRYGECSTTGELVSYTAFGELVTLRCEADPNDPNAIVWTASIGAEIPDGFPRYGYVGGWGYESGLLTLAGVNSNLPPITLQHLGWRWYDPGIGRFVQRDPVGISGGLNTYVYVGNQPLIIVDPCGQVWRVVWRWISGQLVRVAIWVSSWLAKPKIVPRPARPPYVGVGDPWAPRPWQVGPWIRDKYGLWHNLNCVVIDPFFIPPDPNIPLV